MKGKHHTEETKEKIRKANIGKLAGNKHPNWKGGVSRGYRNGHKNDYKYRTWRTSIFERDDYTCQECGVRGVYLEPHHIKSWARHQELRYTISNGVTLCVKCHSKTDNYRGKKKQVCQF